MENETTASTAGRDLNIYAGGALSGTNINGGNLNISSGRATGHGYSSIDFLTVMPRQGNGTAVRNPVSSLTLASNALTIPRGTTAQRPGQAGYQAAANGMIRYNTDNNKFEAYQASGWVDMIGGGAASPTRSIQFNNSGAFAGDANFVFTATNRVGLGTGSPVAKLDVEGAVQVGDNSETCAAAADHGNIRYNGSTIQVCNNYSIGWENMAVGATIVADDACDTTRSFSSPGTHAYKVPADFGTLIIRIWGGGGSGASGDPSDGGGNAGATSSINSRGLYAGGGYGAAVAVYSTGTAGGAGGTALGGDTNTTGNTGDSSVFNSSSGKGADAPSFGGIGGAARGWSDANGFPGNAPGAGGGGGVWTPGAGGGGGSGAFLEKTYTNADLVPGTIISDIVVGAGGAAYGTSGRRGGAGASGRVTIICTSGPPASSSLSLNDLGDVTITAPSNGQALTYNGTNWVNSVGGGAAAGANTHIQFNSGGSAFGGSANLTWNQSTSKFTVTGDIDYTGVTTDISDQRLKENITPLSPALAQIMAMSPVSFTMKSDTKHAIEYGFIAQDIEKIYPDLVKTADDSTQTKSMNYIGLIAPLVKAMQEQQKTIQEQQKRIEALENAVTKDSKN